MDISVVNFWIFLKLMLELLLHFCCLNQMAPNSPAFQQSPKSLWATLEGQESLVPFWDGGVKNKPQDWAYLPARLGLTIQSMKSMYQDLLTAECLCSHCSQLLWDGSYTETKATCWFSTLNSSLEDVSAFQTHKTSMNVLVIASPPTTDIESIPSQAFYWHLFTGRRKITLDGLNSHARRWDTCTSPPLIVLKEAQILQKELKERDFQHNSLLQPPLDPFLKIFSDMRLA